MINDLQPDHPRIAVADCETDPFKKGRDKIAPFIWGWFDGDEYREFRTTDAFIAFVREQDGVCYAHNGGKFDWHFILPHMDGLQDVGIINGRLSRFKVGRCEFRDSYNILPVALSKWQKDEIDYSIFEADVRERPENMTKIRAYLESDCRYTLDMVTQFIRRYGFHLTQAGAAMATWEGMSGLKAPRSDAAYYDAMHKYYYGGRVQCFQTGVRDVKFKVADINSAYPRAMLENHPFKASYSTIRRATHANVLAWIAKRGAGMVFVSCRAKSRGAFPWRSVSGELHFPDDNRPRDFHVSGWEYLAGTETGAVDILSIDCMAVFDTPVSFRDYILHFYELRKRAKASGDKAGDIFSKLLMNSLYGRFAMDSREYEHFLNLPVDHAAIIGKEESIARGMDLTKFHFSGMLGPWALAARPLEVPELKFYNVATSASITGYVRAYLWRTLVRCKNPIYCDTDSIAAEGFGKGIPFGDELGQWKDEGAFDRFAVGGRKLYAFRHDKSMGDKAGTWKTASKGVRLTAEQVERIAAGEEILFENDKPTFSIHHAPRIVNRKVKAVHREVPQE